VQFHQHSFPFLKPPLREKPARAFGDSEKEKEIKDAFSQTQIALDFLSGNMKKGNQAFAQLDKFKQTTTIIYNPKNK
jgi:hypothetical protein